MKRPIFTLCGALLGVALFLGLPILFRSRFQVRGSGITAKMKPLGCCACMS